MVNQENILITGGSSFLGGYLLKALNEYFNVHETYFQNLPTYPLIQWIKVDLSQVDKIQSIIEKIKPGLYKLTDYPFDENENFASVCRANERAVIALLSAASYYELTTYDPPEIYVAVPNNTDKFELVYPPIKVYYFIDKYYQPKIDEINTESGKIKIYTKEKTIVDLFRYKNKLGEDVALESLKTYLKSRDRKVNLPCIFSESNVLSL